MRRLAAQRVHPRQRPPDAITFGLLLLADIAKRYHRLDEMERSGIVQADPLAQIRQADPVPVARDLFQDREGAAERLDADALPVLGVIVDVLKANRAAHEAIAMRLMRKSTIGADGLKRFLEDVRPPVLNGPALTHSESA